MPRRMEEEEEEEAEGRPLGQRPGTQEHGGHTAHRAAGKSSSEAGPPGGRTGEGEGGTTKRQSTCPACQRQWGPPRGT